MRGSLLFTAILPLMNHAPGDIPGAIAAGGLGAGLVQWLALRRTLRAGALTTTAFVLVAAAALIRGFGPALLPPLSAYGLAGTAWIAGYGLFLWRFAPILLTRRVRGS